MNDIFTLENLEHLREAGDSLLSDVALQCVNVKELDSGKHIKELADYVKEVNEILSLIKDKLSEFDLATNPSKIEQLELVPTDDKEVWKEIVGFEGLYYVSSKGKVANKTGYIMTPRYNKDGSASYVLVKNKTSYTLRLNKIMADVF